MNIRTLFVIASLPCLNILFGQYEILDEYPVYHNFFENFRYNYSSSIGGSFQSMPTRLNTMPVNQGNIDYASSTFSAKSSATFGMAGGLNLSPIIHKNFLYTFSPEGGFHWLGSESGYHYRLKHQFGAGYDRFFFIFESARVRKTNSFRREIPEGYSTFDKYSLEIGSSDYLSKQRNASLRILLGDLDEDDAFLKYIEISKISETFLDNSSWKSGGWRATLSNPRFTLSAEYTGNHIARGLNFTQSFNPNVPNTGRFIQFSITKRLSNTVAYY